MNPSPFDTGCQVMSDWLGRYAADGYPAPGPQVRAWLDLVALAAPSTAVKLPRLMRALTPAVREQVTRAGTTGTASPHVSGPHGTTFDTGRPGAAPSMVSVKVAADLIGISERAVRKAAASGRLTATRHAATGEWRFSVADVEAYRVARQGAAA